MLSKRIAREPLTIIGSLFPFVMLARYVPGLPIPANPGLPWRMELLTAMLLCATLALLLRRTLRTGSGSTGIDRTGFGVLASGVLFIFWTALSALWAASPAPALHYALQWSGYLVFFVLMRCVVAKPRLARGAWIALGVTIWILGVSSMIEFWLGAPPTQAGARGGTTPVFRASSHFGEITAVAACLFAALTLYVRRPRYAFACGATAALAWASTFHAMQRAPLVGAACGLFLIGAGCLVKSNCRPHSFSRLCLLVVALACVSALYSVPAPTAAAASPAAPSTVDRLRGDLRQDIGTRIRLLFWRIGVEMLRAHPVRGVGANNYEVAYPEARRAWAARDPNSPDINLEEENLAAHAHNEYVQIAAELGVVGLALFAVFASALSATFLRALRHQRHALPALGAGGAMLAFALSSGASASSFRSFGGGLLFFFAAGIIARVAATTSAEAEPHAARERAHDRRRLRLDRCLVASGLVLASIMLCSFAARGAAAVLEGTAQNTHDPLRAERLYRRALWFNPLHASLRYDFGMWLYLNGRAAEAVPHLRYAVARGFNSTPCYAYLAAAEKMAGDLRAAERTTAEAASVYPRSTYALVRHATALASIGDYAAAGNQLDRAVSFDERRARGWLRLLDGGTGTTEAARGSIGVASPGELSPAACVYASLIEQELTSVRVESASRGATLPPAAE